VLANSPAAKAAAVNALQNVMCILSFDLSAKHGEPSGIGENRACRFTKKLDPALQAANGV
jgi:hypothetical protein